MSLFLTSLLLSLSPILVVPLVTECFLSFLPTFLCFQMNLPIFEILPSCLVAFSLEAFFRFFKEN